MMNSSSDEKSPSTVTPANHRHIRKVAVLGSGVMGSRIACHFAHIGLDVLLLDIVPLDLKEEQKNNSKARNQIVNNALKTAVKSKPSPIYHQQFLNNITTGNFEDDLDKIASCDWVIEVIIERLDIKKTLFDKVEKLRKPGSLVTSNTSGIPISMLAEGRSEEFQQHFCGTHFFNPPRYLNLFEIIPHTTTDPEVIQFFEHYADLFLGKTPVLAKDTPAFIANRIGVFSMSTIFQLMNDFDLSIGEIDVITGPLTGKPKSATFRTADVVGLDTLIKVAKGVYDNCPEDERRSTFQIPDFVLTMEKNQWLGDKTGQGFYKKSKNEQGKRVFLELDPKTLEYKETPKRTFDSIAQAKSAGSLQNKLRVLSKGNDEAARFNNTVNAMVFQYCAHRIPEISDELYRIDDGMRTGFGWKMGPFEMWDTIGVQEALDQMTSMGFEAPQWVHSMLSSGASSFYKHQAGQRMYWDIPSASYKAVPGQEHFILLANRKEDIVWKNSGTNLYDLGEGVLNLEFKTKMNSIGGEVLEGINHAIAKAEDEGWKGLVLGNDASNFSAGANLAMILMLAVEQEYDELDIAIRQFQQTAMRIRHSSIPVVAGPHGMTLGGGCEITMHSDAALASAETYIGLVEVGAGVIPAGGGCKELALRASDYYHTNDPKIPRIVEAFTHIATAKVASSAHEAFDLGLLDKRKDEVVMNAKRVIAEAKKKVLELHNNGYSQPPIRKDIEVVGRSGMAALLSGLSGFELGNYATPHDITIAKKIAYVLCGGDLSMPSKVSEQYLLDLEREAFLSLCGEIKTQQRMESILKTGKPLRN